MTTNRSRIERAESVIDAILTDGVLTDCQVEIIFCVLLNGWSDGFIAHDLGCSRQNIQQQRQDAIRRIRRHIQAIDYMCYNSHEKQYSRTNKPNIRKEISK